VSASLSGGDNSTQVTVSWTPPALNGASGVSYTVARFGSGAGAQGCATGAVPGAGTVIASGISGTSAVDNSALTVGESYSYVVYADNGWGCASVVSNNLRIVTTPSAPTVATTLESAGGGLYRAVAQISPTVSGSIPASEYTYRVDGESIGSTTTVHLSNSGDYGTPNSWNFQQCISDGTQPRCSGAVTVSATPVNANAKISQCTPGSDASGNVQMVTPGGATWPSAEFKYAFKQDLVGWSSWGSSAVVPQPLLPGGTVTMAVLTIDSTGSFTNGDDPGSLAASNLLVCH
jgi:hypothetical protein